MSDDKTPLEQAVEGALDAFVYAPIGLLFEGPALFPKLVEQGKAQVKTARVFGQFAVQTGQGEAAKRVGKVQGQVLEALGSLGLAPKAQPAPAPAAAPAAPAPRVEAAAPVAPAAAPAPDVDTLSIPDYDSLSASQVVARLAGLGAAELESVRRYEAAKRARKTILNKVAQLQK